MCIPYVLAFFLSYSSPGLVATVINQLETPSRVAAVGPEDSLVLLERVPSRGQGKLSC
jgi:hypothetical protein